MRITWFLLILALIAIVLSIPMIDRNQVDSKTQQNLKSESAPLVPPPPQQQRQP